MILHFPKTFFFRINLIIWLQNTRHQKIIQQMLKSYEFEVIIRTHIVNSSISEETVYIQSRSFPANRLVKHMGHSVQKTNSKITNFE